MVTMGREAMAAWIRSVEESIYTREHREKLAAIALKRTLHNFFSYKRTSKLPHSARNQSLCGTSLFGITLQTPTALAQEKTDGEETGHIEEVSDAPFTIKKSKDFSYEENLIEQNIISIWILSGETCSVGLPARL